MHDFIITQVLVCRSAATPRRITDIDIKVRALHRLPHEIQLKLPPSRDTLNDITLTIIHQARELYNKTLLFCIN